MTEIEELEERAPGEKPAPSALFRWDGEQYQRGPAPAAAPDGGQRRGP